MSSIQYGLATESSASVSFLIMLKIIVNFDQLPGVGPRIITRIDEYLCSDKDSLEGISSSFIILYHMLIPRMF